MNSRLTLDKDSGDQHWLNSNNKLHREDGPAIVCRNGGEFWILNNKSHRVGGPAHKFSNGQYEWIVDDNLHRLDGPAIEWVDYDISEWYIDDVQYTEEEFNVHPLVVMHRFIHGN